MPIAISSLDSKALAARLRELAADRRNVDVDFILHLDEFDRRRAFLEAGYGSLWAYCMEALHLCEGSAGRRIQAMKVLRRFPSLEGALRDGRLTLSTIALLGQVATPDCSPTRSPTATSPPFSMRQSAAPSTSTGSGAEPSPPAARARAR